MIYGYVLIKLMSMTFFSFHTLKMESNCLKIYIYISTPSSQKMAIHLFHTYSSCHILLCLPKAFRDAQHLMPELV